MLENNGLFNSLTEYVRKDFEEYYPEPFWASEVPNEPLPYEIERDKDILAHDIANKVKRHKNELDFVDSQNLY